jgi:hypothetical protein
MLRVTTFGCVVTCSFRVASVRLLVTWWTEIRSPDRGVRVWVTIARLYPSPCTGSASTGSGGLMGAHGSSNVSVWGGSGNFGIMDSALSTHIFFCWGGTGFDISAIVRRPAVNESSWETGFDERAARQERRICPVRCYASVTGSDPVFLLPRTWSTVATIEQRNPETPEPQYNFPSYISIGPLTTARCWCRRHI